MPRLVSITRERIEDMYEAYRSGQAVVTTAEELAVICKLAMTGFDWDSAVADVEAEMRDRSTDA